MLTQFKGYSPIEPKAESFPQRVTAEGVYRPLPEDVIRSLKKEGNAFSFLEGKREEIALDKAMGLRFTFDGKMFAIGAQITPQGFLLFCALPIGEKEGQALLSMLAERIFAGREQGELILACPARKKGTASAAAFQRLLNGAYILLMNLLREDILNKGQLFEVLVEKAPDRETAAAIGEKLLNLGKISCAEAILEGIFAISPKIVTKKLKITLASTEEKVVLCKEDAVFPLREETADRIFSSAQVRLLVTLDRGTESFCCWKQLV